MIGVPLLADLSWGLMAYPVAFGKPAQAREMGPPGDGNFGRHGSGRWRLREAWLREMEASGGMALGGSYSEAWKSESGLWEVWAHGHGLAELRCCRGSLTTTRNNI